MPKLEVFFDYACPYCLRGHKILLELLPQYPGIEVEWRPCEAHPRPDRYGRHSDLCARGMYFAWEQGADLMEYHAIMYRAALTDCADIEDLCVLSRYVDGLLDTDAFYDSLASGAYLDELLENNRLAWETYSFLAVPSCRMNEQFLKCVEDVGLSKQQLAAFIEQNQ